MRVTRRLVQGSALIAGAVGAAAVAAPDTQGGRAVRRLADRLSHDVRYAVSTAPGILYRLAGREPDANVSDDVLADRIRSSIGPLLKKLDIPHVHVMVERHVALLHGDVAREWDADEIERAVMSVSGVDGVESHLHVGLLEGDTRPSQGRIELPPPSGAMHAFLTAATEAGSSEPRSAVHAVLCRFIDRIPEGERAHVFAHLPADAKDLVGQPRRHGRQRERLQTLNELVAVVEADAGIAPERAEQLTRQVIATLRALVDEEANDVAAVLPPSLRDAWQTLPTS